MTSNIQHPTYDMISDVQHPTPRPIVRDRIVNSVVDKNIFLERELATLTLVVLGPLLNVNIFNCCLTVSKIYLYDFLGHLCRSTARISMMGQQLKELSVIFHQHVLQIHPTDI